jgi:hypothetical protein
LAPRRRCLSPISAADLLSTSTRWILNSLAWDLRPSACRDLSYACSRATANIDVEPSTTAPDSRCRHFRPRVATPLAWCQPAETTVSVPFGLFGFPNEDSHRSFQLGTSPVMWPQAPPVVPPGSPSRPGLPKRTRTFSTSWSPNLPASEIQSAFRR